MSNIDKLVIEFLKGTCTAEQADLLVQYFAEHPDEMEKYFGEGEWKLFQPDNQMPDAVSLEVWQGISKYFPEKKKQKNYLTLRNVLVAALAILLPLSTWFYFQQSSLLKNDTINETALITKVTIANSRDHSIETLLPDGSTVTLEKGASITYDSVFSPTERRVVLNEGKALFDVVGNAHHPFVVQTNEIVTIALGTSFYVDKKGKDQSILVQLLSGKVALRSESNKIIMNEILLQPGQQCYINQKTMEATLSSFKTIAIAKSEDTTVKHTSGKKKNQSTKATWSYFKKPLNELLDIFSQYYNISIEYDKDEMKKLYFTGDLLQDDSMRKNISIICIASGLEYDLNEEVLIIRKREE